MRHSEVASIDDLKPYENNPRLNDGAVDAVAASIEKFGFNQPIVIDKDGVIIAGHTRYKAAQKLGMTEVPVIKADDLDEEEVKAYRLADNKTAELALWDFGKLEEELADITMDMGDFGFITPSDSLSVSDDDFITGTEITKSKDKTVTCPACGEVFEV